MFAVIFEVCPRPEAWDDYLGHAATLRPELLAIDGFVANERYASLTRQGWLVSLSIWRDEKALIRWRTHALHNEIQGKGRSSVFADYHLRIGEIVKDTQSQETLAQTRSDVTQVGAAPVVSITEREVEHGPMAEADMFDSITRPGNALHIKSWPDLASTEAQFGESSGRHRIVQVIRDYGMFARVEAPQYFPPA